MREPDDFTLLTAVECAQMLARGEDAAMMIVVVNAYRTIRSASARHQLEGLGTFTSAIGRWRSELWTEGQVKQSLENVMPLLRQP